MHVDPDRLLFMFDERILIFLKSDSFYLPSVKTPKMAANPLKKTEIRRYTTEVPAFRPFFQRYGWTLWYQITVKKCVRPFVFRNKYILDTFKILFRDSVFCEYKVISLFFQYDATHFWVCDPNKN